MKLRKDKDEPMCKKSRTEMDDPRRPKLRSDIADAQFAKS